MADEDFSLNNPKIVDAFRQAGAMANRGITLAKELVVEGALPSAIVAAVTAAFKEEHGLTSKKKKKVSMGISFPLCVSVNETVGHYSPAEDKAEEVPLAAGDLVKLDFGAHCNGCPAVAATTVVVGGTTSEQRASVLAAAHTALQAAVRAVVADGDSARVTELVGQVAAEFGVFPVEGVLSHSMERYVIDGDKVIINKETEDQKVDAFPFASPSVFAIDVVLASTDARPQELDHTETSVYKLNPTVRPALKLKTTRSVYSALQRNAPSFPFTHATVPDLSIKPSSFQLGLSQLKKDNAIVTYPVARIQDGHDIAHFKATVLIAETGKRSVLTHIDPIPDMGVPVPEIQDADLKAHLATALQAKKKNKNKKKKNKANPAQA